MPGPTSNASGSGRFSRSSVQSALAAALLTTYVVAAVTSVSQKSITFDELAHLTGGTSSWLASDYRLFPQNGQLPQRWATLPLVAVGVNFPSLDQPAWWTSNLEAMGYQFLYAAGNDHDAMLGYARLAMIPVGVLVGVVCYVWARRLFGWHGGMVALAVCALSPSMLAHGPLATSDVTAALMFIGSLGCFWLVLHRAGPVRLLGSTLLMGLLFVTKMSAWLMVPIALMLAVWRIGYGRPFVWSTGRRRVFAGRRRLLAITGAMLVAHGIGVVCVIWACYGFRYATFDKASPGRDHQFLGETIESISGGQIAGLLVIRARDRRLLPEAYLFGLAHVVDRAGRFVGFLDGRYSVNGWWYFFPYVWLLKTPLPVFGLLGLSAAFGWRSLRGAGAARSRVRSRASYRIAPLVVFLAVYWTAAALGGLNLGERHVLPTYPALFILAGGAACWARTRHRVAATATGVLLLLLLVEALATWPHYLSYFNRAAGGPAGGYRHVVDSSLDWGQDLPGLKQWLDRMPHDPNSDSPVYLSYFGSGDPAHYGINARQLYSYQDWRTDRPLYELTGGIYAISATMLQSIYTRAPGPWTVGYERAYQALRLEIERVRSRGQAPVTAARDADSVAGQRLQRDFDELRLARLCAYLRRRPADDHIGYSILIFRLSDEQVAEALTGPPAELWPEIGIEGLASSGAGRQSATDAVRPREGSPPPERR
jgi:hypothetical protein